MPKTKLQGGIYVTMPDGLGGDTIQVTSLPAASASELGKIYQFVGTTTSDYTNGYFYECVSDGAATPTYSWTRKNVQPAGAGSSAWGQITGTLSSQTDLQSALDAKGTYSKPSGGIPASDLASDVQTSLGKADSALQSHQDISTKADKVSGTHTNEIVTLDSGGNVQASGKTVADFAEPSPRGAETVTAGATAITVALVANKMHTIDLTNAGSAVTLTFSASKTGLDLTKENVLRAKVLVPASGVAVTFAWDSVTSAGTLAWAGENAPAFTAGKTTEVNIDLAIGNVNFEGMSVEF